MMLRVTVGLNREAGTAFLAELPEDDPELVVWIPDGDDPLAVEKYVDSMDAAETLRDQWHAMLATLGVAKPGIAIVPVQETDWATDWRSHFRLERVGDRLVVCPDWQPYEPRPGEWVIRIDPGMSFGTGQHGTTRACLRLLDRCRAGRGGRPRFLDVGCGSGILSIAAARMGFHGITAIDHDAQALRDTRKNSARNDVGDRVTALTADLAQFRPAEAYDVVAANLLADVLTAHAATVAAWVRREPPGDLILSGILRGQYAAVRSAYRALGFTEVDALDDGDWRSGWLRRRP